MFLYSFQNSGGGDWQECWAEEAIATKSQGSMDNPHPEGDEGLSGADSPYGDHS